MIRVLRLDPTAVPQVVDVLHESFYDYPVMRFVLGVDASDYATRLRTLIHFFVMPRVFRDEILLGVPAGGGELLGVALVSRPGGPAPPPEFHELRTNVWTELGADAEARYGAFTAACAPFRVETPHLHLNMIGVRRATQGTGVGRKLLEAVHDLSSRDRHSSGVTLTTEHPRNVTLYQHFGYEVVVQATVGPGLTTWGFYRPDER